jgi:hypothetical protein
VRFFFFFRSLTTQAMAAFSTLRAP